MLNTLQILRQDVTYALRQLRQRPGFTIVAILVLGLGLGGNAAMFSVVNAVLLRPLPYADPQKLTALFERDVVGEAPFNPVAPANFLDWQRDARDFEQIAATGETAFNLASQTGSFVPERIDGSYCSANLFTTLGVAPAVGRTFRTEEDRPGAAHVAVISYDLWQRRFAHSPDVIHRQIRLDNEQYDKVGVMPRGFGYPYRTVKVWVPLQRYLSAEQLQTHGDHMLTVVGRLRPGVSVEQGRSEIDGIVRRYKQQHPEEVMGKGGNVVSLYRYSVKDVRTSLLILFGAVGCVLIIACVNVANLLLTRALGRQREVAIRAAVGATRGRIIRQLLTESIILSLLGAACGLFLASFATDALASRARCRLSAWSGPYRHKPLGVPLHLRRGAHHRHRGRIVPSLPRLAYGCAGELERPLYQHGTLARTFSRCIGRGRSGSLAGAPGRRRTAAAQLQPAAERSHRRACRPHAHYGDCSSGGRLQRARESVRVRP